MTQIGYDSFTRANQSGFGTASDGNTYTITGTGTTSIAANEGVIVSTGSDTHARLGSATSGDMELVCRVAINNAGDTLGIQGRFSVSGGNTTCYKLLWYGGALHLNKAVSGASTQLTSFTLALTNGTFYWMHLLIIGSTLYGSMWQDGTAEPAWQTQTTDTSVTGSGGMALLGNTAAASSVRFDHFYAVDYRNIQQLSTFSASASTQFTNSYTTTITDTALSTFSAVGAVMASPSPAASSQSIVSLYYQKIQMVQVFDPYGNFLAVWPDAPHISGLKDTVNCAQGQIKMVLPRTIDSYGALGQASSNGSVATMNQVKIYVFGPGLPATGLLKFNGFIDTIEASVTDTQQQSVTVTLTPWSAAFGDHGYGGSLQFNNIDPIQLFKFWFTTTDSITGVKYTDPMTWDPGNPSSSGKLVNYLIQSLDLKSIADVSITMLGSGWFWRPNPDNTVTIGQAPAAAQHVFQLGKHFASMSYSVDNTQRKNVIYVVGNTLSVKATAVGASAKPPNQGGIGERLLQIKDSRLTDIASAQIVANALLSIYDVPQTRAKFRVVDYRGNSSGALGFDIESLKVGDSIAILDSRGKTFPSTWGNFVWGQSRWGQSEGAVFNLVIPIASIDYNWSYADIEAGILAPSQDRRLWQLQRKFSDFTLGV